MQVIFFRTAAGREPVREYFTALAESERAAAADVFCALRQHGLQAPGVIFRQVRGKLWEFRINGTVSHRVFYVTVRGSTMVLLHSYKKQGQKAPLREIAIAERRKREVFHEKQ